jgi:hypothetical protein
VPLPGAVLAVPIVVPSVVPTVVPIVVIVPALPWPAGLTGDGSELSRRP